MNKKIIFIFLFLVFLPSLAKADYGVAKLFFKVTEEVEVTLINFTIPNPNVPQGQSVEFDVEIQNIGSLNANVTSIIEIFNNATNEYVDTVTKSYENLAPSEIVTIKSSWSTSVLGTYKAVAKVMYDGKNTTTQTKHFSVVSPPTPPVGPPVGPIVPPPSVVVEFVQCPVLKEIAAGQATVLGIVVKNTGNSIVSGLSVEVSGIPKEWVTVNPKTLDLDINEKKGFTIAIGVPSNVSAGDYKVLITLSNGAVHAENFFILRVRSFVPEYDKPMFMKVVNIDTEAGKTNVDIVVNSKNSFPLVEVIERIPKELANTSDVIDFKTLPTEIISRDPVIKWNIINLKAGEERKISYSVPKILEEFSKYIYWPLEQVNILVSTIPKGFRIAEAKIPVSYPGKNSTVAFTIENTEDVSYNFSASLELPAGWKIWKGSVKDSIQPKQRKTLVFNFFVPGETVPGTYLFKLYLSWDGSETIKEYPIIIQSFIPIRILLYIAIGFCTVVLLYFVLRKLRQKRFSMEEKLKIVRREITKE